MTTLSVGSILVLSKSYFDNNVFITQYFPALKLNTEYEVVEIAEFDTDIGVSILKNVDTEEIIDISTVDELESYWCLIDTNDSFRIIQ